MQTAHCWAIIAYTSPSARCTLQIFQQEESTHDLDDLCVGDILAEANVRSVAEVEIVLKWPSGVELPGSIENFWIEHPGQGSRYDASPGWNSPLPSRSLRQNGLARAITRE